MSPGSSSCSPVITPPAKRKRGRPRKIQPSDSTSKALVAPSKTKIQRNSKTSDVPTTRSSPTFEITALVLQKDTLVKGRGGKASKVVKNDPVPYSVDITVDLSWTEFLNNLRVAMHLPNVHQLRQETFRWFFGKQDIKLPLCSQEDFERLLRRFGERKASQTKLAYLQMQPPLQVLKTAHDERVCFI